MEDTYSPETFDTPKKRIISFAEIILLGVTFLFGFVSWALFQHILFVISSGGVLGTEGGYSYTFLAITILSFLLYLSFTSLFLIFSSKRVAYIGSMLLSVIPLMLITGVADIKVISISVVLFYLAVSSAAYSMQRAYRNQIKFFLPGILRIGLSVLLLVSAAVVSIIHFSVITSKDDAANSIEKSVVRYSVAGLNAFMKQFDGYSPSMSVNDFVLFAGSHGLIQGDFALDNSALLEQLNGVVDVEALAANVAGDQRTLISNEFLKTLGIDDISIDGNSPITDVWSAYTKGKKLGYLDSYKRFLPAIVSLGIFLTLLFLNKGFKIIIYGFTWALIHMLRLVKVLAYEEEAITIKRLKHTS